MSSWKSNDYTYAFSCYLLSLCIPGMIYPKFVIETINNFAIGKILRFLDPLPAPTTPEIVSLYRVIFSLGSVISVIYNINAKHDTYIRGTVKSLSFFALSIIANYLAGNISSGWLIFVIQDASFAVFTMYNLSKENKPLL